MGIEKYRKQVMDSGWWKPASFLRTEYPQSSSICRWDFPVHKNHPAIVMGNPHDELETKVYSWEKPEKIPRPGNLGILLAT